MRIISNCIFLVFLENKEHLNNLIGGEITHDRETTITDRFENRSEEELQLLKRLYCEDGIDISDITLQLGRSELAVCQQLTKLGLLSPQGKPRARKKKPLTAQCLCPLCQVSDCAHCEKECPHAGTV